MEYKNWKFLDLSVSWNSWINNKFNTDKAHIFIYIYSYYHSSLLPNNICIQLFESFSFPPYFLKNSITSSFLITSFCNIVVIYHISMLFHLISFRDVCFLAASTEVRVCPTGKNKHIHARVSFLGPETDVILKWVRDSKFSS